MSKLSYIEDSFIDRHPIIAWIGIVAFLIIAIIPGIAMSVPAFACAINAVEPWCPAEAYDVAND